MFENYLHKGSKMLAENAESTYEDLLQLLKEAGYEWVIENVEVLIDNGVPQEEKLVRYKEPTEADDFERRPSQRTETVLGHRSHTPDEKLQLLLQEMHRCLVFPLQIAGELTRRLSSEGNTITAIELVDESDSVEFTINSSNSGLMIQEKAATTLSKVIEEIHKEI